MSDEITSPEFHNKLKKRNKEAFRILYEHFKIPLYHLVYSIIKDNEKTSDIIQDTFIKIIKNIDQLENIKRIKYWIYKIAVNQTINIIKKDKRFAYAGDNLELIADKMVSHHSHINKKIDAEELYFMIRKEVGRLPLKQRVAFTLKYVENMKEIEIAEILNIPVGTVKSRLSVARNKIKNSLNSEKTTINNN